MADVKMTKTQMFEAIKAIPEVAKNEEMVEFIDKQIAQLAKRKTAETKTQKENVILMDKVLLAMEAIGRKATATEIMKSDEELATYSLPKISAMLKKLIECGKVERTIEKKIAYFEVASTDVEQSQGKGVKPLAKKLVDKMFKMCYT